MIRQKATWTCWAALVLMATAAARGQAPLPPLEPIEPGPAQPAGGSSRQTEYARVELLASQDAIRPGDPFFLAVRFRFLQPGLHAYGHDSPGQVGLPTRVIPLAPRAFRFGRPTYPASHKAELAGLAWTEYDRDFSVFVPVTAPADLVGPQVAFEVRTVYQVCSATTCYESYDEQSEPLKLTVPVRPAGAAVNPVEPELFASARAAATAPDQPSEPPTTASEPTTTAAEPTTTAAEPTTTAAEPAGPPADRAPVGRSRWEDVLASTGWPVALLISLLVGLTLNLTPCVLPIIPLTVGYFVYQSQQGDPAGQRRRVVLAGLLFAAALVATFAALGAVVVLARGQFQALFERPAAVLGLGLFIVVMALGMFGVYPIRLPGFIGRLSGGRSGPGGALVMGGLAAVLSTPCTGPFIGSMIGWAVKAPPALGMAAFVGIGLGMAAPYVLLTAAPGLLDRVPRTGRWTELVKIGLGFVLLALALIVLAGLRGQPARMHYALWAALVLSATVWAASHVVRGGEEGAGWVWPSRLVLLALAVAGIAYFWPAEKPPLAPADASAGPGRIAGRAFMIGQTTWYHYDPKILDRAREAGLPVLLDLVSDNCTYCEIMEARVWPTDRAGAALRGIVPIRANISRSFARPLQARFGTRGTPALVVLDAQGELVERFENIPFYNDPAGFAAAMGPVRQRLGLGE